MTRLIGVVDTEENRMDLMDILVSCDGFLRSHIFQLCIHHINTETLGVIATSCHVRALSVNIKNLNPLLSVFLSLPSCYLITVCHLQ